MQFDKKKRFSIATFIFTINGAKMQTAEKNNNA